MILIEPEADKLVSVAFIDGDRSVKETGIILSEGSINTILLTHKWFMSGIVFSLIPSKGDENDGD